MIPESLIPAHFHISNPEPAPGVAENNADLTQGKITLENFEADLLAAPVRHGQSRNMLLEERDRHIKDRLFRVMKIEAYARVLNDLQMEAEIDTQELSQIIAEYTDKINEAGNEIWLNLITQEKTASLFYDFQAE
ncbi:hypothetical protein SIL08_07530 [Scandinavium sp. V105_16]|uniref:Uncharacterized protein n=1 Tax=Scandinavium lactucae TaxID=3095028 RepID=A0AAJ2VTJ1_9ENTR|nr:MULTISPECIES: hypothetical protein [unclassified Scandinavium]MDX6020122.1 hypothetical protein [Scandinavium sp. V105_16]MDX6032111.1 hypothetical protein [Scandinavium sp. V105_12]